MGNVRLVVLEREPDLPAWLAAHPSRSGSRAGNERTACQTEVSTLRRELARKYGDGIRPVRKPFGADVVLVESILAVPMEFVCFHVLERRENGVPAAIDRRHR